MRSLFDSISSSATFSPCRSYRYTLTRRWYDDLPLLNWIMLNPSTADEVENDPTVERCERRARMLNYGGIIVTNLFAWRATDPSELKMVEDPVGPENDEAIVESAYRAQLVVCAWGNDGKILRRSTAVKKRLHIFSTLHILKLSKEGEPVHPLYQPYHLKPVAWDLTGSCK